MPAPVESHQSNPYDFFQISVGGRENSNDAIKRHAWEGLRQKHDLGNGINDGCHGVAKLIDTLVNKRIMNNAPLANNSKLSDIIRGDQAEEKAKAFRIAAKQNQSVDWSIDESTETLTISVQGSDQNPDLFNTPDEKTPRNSLTLNNRNVLVLTLYYSDFSSTTAPHKTPTEFAGDYCHLAIAQVKHAIEHIRKDSDLSQASSDNDTVEMGAKLPPREDRSIHSNSSDSSSPYQAACETDTSQYTVNRATLTEDPAALRRRLEELEATQQENHQDNAKEIARLRSLLELYENSLNEIIRNHENEKNKTDDALAAAAAALGIVKQ